MRLGFWFVPILLVVFSGCSDNETVAATPAASALEQIRQYQDEQDRFFGQHGRYGTLPELHLHEATYRAFQEGLGGYRFAAEVDKMRYAVTARPAEWGGETKVSYYGDQTGTVHRSEEERPADAGSPVAD